MRSSRVIGPVRDIVTAQARKKALRIIQRIRAHIALEEQTEGLGNEAAMVEELVTEMIREMPMDVWK